MSGLAAKLKKAMHGSKDRRSGEYGTPRKSGEYETPPRRSEDLGTASSRTSQYASVLETPTIRSVRPESSTYSDDVGQETFSTPTNEIARSPTLDHVLPPLSPQETIDLNNRSVPYEDHIQRKPPAFEDTPKSARLSNPVHQERGIDGEKSNEKRRSVQPSHHSSGSRSSSSAGDTDDLEQRMGDMNLNHPFDHRKSIERKPLPPGFDPKLLPPGFDLNDSVDTTHYVEQSPAVTHEVQHRQITEIVQERITREIHIDHVYNYIQPIKVVEVGPAQHFTIDPDTGEKIRIPTPEGWQIPEGTLLPRSEGRDFGHEDFATQEYHYSAGWQNSVGESPDNVQYLRKKESDSL